jgi:hypothetical protein
MGLTIPQDFGNGYDVFRPWLIPADPNEAWTRLYNPLGYVGLRFAAADGVHYGGLGLTVE